MAATHAALAHTKDWKPVFLADFARHGCVSFAATAAGVNRTTVYRHLAGGDQEDSVFVANFALAEEQARDVLRKEAHRRGVEGVDEPVYQGGKKVGTVRKYSDRLLEKLLEARCAEHRPKSLLELSGPNGGPVQTTVTVVSAVPRPAPVTGEVPTVPTGVAGA